MKLLSYFMESKKSTNETDILDKVQCLRQNPTMFLRLDLFLWSQWKVAIEVVGGTLLWCVHYKDLCTLRQTQQDRYSFFLFFYWQRETYPVSFTLFFFSFTWGDDQVPKISHISNNLTLSKTFNFEDIYHLKISQSSDHYWKRDYIVGHLTQDYSDVGQLTPEYGHEKMMLCHQVPQLSLSVGPTFPS